MSSIEKIDKNFKVETKITKDDIKFFDIDESPFKIHGIFKENGKYRRMPESIAKTVSEGVYSLHAHTAGGRVRFATDSKYIAISTSMSNFSLAPHGTFTGTAGFDLYVGDTYYKTFIPPINMTDGFESVVDFENRQLREVTINFPRFSDVEHVYVGIQEDAALKEASPYKNTKPVVYYGSSITQGGCASRPGRAYQAIISRRFNYDFINLGFSGSACAEDEIANYIKELDMSLFVYDYDYNTHSVEHLNETHEKMFKTVRNANPELPIIIMSRPRLKAHLRPYEVETLKIIETTYKNAISSGDKNVYFLNGDQLMALCGHEGTVDDCHPTDFGFASMAKALGDVIQNIDVI